MTDDSIAEERKFTIAEKGAMFSIWCGFNDKDFVKAVTIFENAEESARKEAMSEENNPLRKEALEILAKTYKKRAEEIKTTMIYVEQLEELAEKAEKADLKDKARELYEKIIDFYEKKGDFYVAARFADQEGFYEKAVELYEKANLPGHALVIARSEGMSEKANELEKKVYGNDDFRRDVFRYNIPVKPKPKPQQEKLQAPKDPFTNWVSENLIGVNRDIALENRAELEKLTPEERKTFVEYYRFRILEQVNDAKEEKPQGLTKAQQEALDDIATRFRMLELD